MKKALVVEDDPDIVELIAHYLRAEGFEVEAASDGRAGLERLRAGSFQVVVLDLQLPGMDGLSLCGEIRRDKRTRSLPVIMLTARGDEADRVVGLEVGADDYVVKPFSPKELVARVRALLRRTERREDEDEAPLRDGLLEIDETRHVVRWKGESDPPHREGVRAPPRPRRGPRPRALPPVAARGHLGLQLRRGDEDGGRSRPPPPGEAARPRRAAHHGKVTRVSYGSRGRAMKGLSLRGRMVTTAVVAAGLALLVLLLLAGPRLTARAREQSFAALGAEARLMARVVEDELGRGVPPEGLDPVVDAAARDVEARVTVIARDGRVLGDSAVSGAELARLENHARRPEVQEALAGRVARSERRSATVGAELLYVAVPIRSGDTVFGVARLSRNRADIEAAGNDLWWTAAVALGLALVATGLLSLLLSASLARSLGEIMDTARQFANGNLSARIKVRRDDELGELAQIINRSGDQLQERVAEIARDRGRTEAILTAMDDGVLAVDHRGTVILANPHLSRALDLVSPLGRHYLEVVRQQEVGALIESVLRTGERREAEVELIHQRRYYTITAVPFPGAEGAPQGAVLTFNDATERRRVEDMRRDFVANASHELRTPLTSIRGFVEALEDGAMEQPETAQRFLGKIRTHADRMATLIEDLLELSRLEGRDANAAWTETAVTSVVEEVAAAFAGAATRKDISLRRSDRGAPTVVTDPERLRRILENLVDNAVKYTPNGGSVEIIAPRRRRRRRALRGRRQRPRHRRRAPRAGSSSGSTGWTRRAAASWAAPASASRSCKHLAESMGASVTVDSAPGRGSRFAVLVPARPQAAAAPVEARAAAPRD